jgi:aromatic amino acid aminotransferase I
MRLGWITCNKMFYETLVNYTDSATQHPHALGQLFIAEMLGSNGWQIDGFCRWMKSLCEDYQRRRDLFLRVFHREVGQSGYATTSTPQAGMFFWIEVHLERHPRYDTANSVSSIPILMEELFNRLVDAGVVLMPASLFMIEEDLQSIGASDRIPTGNVRPHHLPFAIPGRLFLMIPNQRLNFLRATFCGTEETIETGLTRFGRVLRDFFLV